MDRITKDAQLKGTRAYSTMNIKAADAKGRRFTGIASSISTDRMGDIVMPRGMQAKFPVPLLYQHKHSQPIGWVHRARVSDTEIEVDCEIAIIDEPGAMKDLVDMAWTAISSGLVRGLSIGFDPIEYSIIEESYGYKFIAWELIELSTVTVPANRDCSIQTIKSLDSETRAALGRKRSVVVRIGESPPGAPGPQAQPASSGLSFVPKGTNVKTIQERIADFLAERQKAVDDISAIVNKSVESGETLSQEDEDKHGELTARVKAIDKHIDLLKSSELLMVKAAPAARVEGGNGGNGGGQSLEVRANARISVEGEKLEKGMAFARFAKCMALARGRASDALEIAKAHYSEAAPLHNILKAAVAAGTTTDSTWGGALVEYNLYTQDFIEYLRPMTILGKFGQNGIPSLNGVPFNIEVMRQTSGGGGYWVGQGKAVPLTKFDYDRVNLGWSKVGNIAVLTKEQVRFSNPQADTLVRNALGEALMAKLDADFISPAVAAVANVSPASITNGVSASQASGVDEDAVDSDCQTMMRAFITANISMMQGVWIMSANRALALSMMKNTLGQKIYPEISMLGGRFQGLPVIVSQYVPNSVSGGDIVVLVAANEVYLADDGQVQIDASDSVSLEMSDAPSQTAAAGTGASMVSMWQTNSIAMKAERFINWQKRRSAAVAYCDNVHWGE